MRANELVKRIFLKNKVVKSLLALVWNLAIKSVDSKGIFALVKLVAVIFRVKPQYLLADIDSAQEGVSGTKLNLNFIPKTPPLLNPFPCDSPNA